MSSFPILETVPGCRAQTFGRLPHSAQNSMVCAACSQAPKQRDAELAVNEHGLRGQPRETDSAQHQRLWPNKTCWFAGALLVMECGRAGHASALHLVTGTLWMDRWCPGARTETLAMLLLQNLLHKLPKWIFMQAGRRSPTSATSAGLLPAWNDGCPGFESVPDSTLHTAGASIQLPALWYDIDDCLEFTYRLCRLGGPG